MIIARLKKFEHTVRMAHQSSKIAIMPVLCLNLGDVLGYVLKGVPMIHGAN